MEIQNLIDEILEEEKRPEYEVDKGWLAMEVLKRLEENYIIIKKP